MKVTVQIKLMGVLTQAIQSNPIILETSQSYNDFIMQIDQLMKKYKIENYSLLKDGTQVNGDLTKIKDGDEYVIISRISGG